jgi:FHA domain
MTDQIKTILLFTCLILGFLILWAAGIAFTFWDASRRKLPTGELIAWIALAALIPLIGASAYLFSRALGVWFSPRSPGSTPARKRSTWLKRVPQPEAHSGTYLAADLLQNTYAAPKPARPQTQADLPLDARSAARLYLKAIDGPHTGQEYPVFSLPAQIGRVPEAAVRLDQDLGVSRHHAEIYEQAGELRIRDLGSAHGTRMGGSNIEDRELEPGEQIQVGVTTLVIQIGEGRK